MTAELLDRIQGCLLGVLIGDAMGMPWEGKKSFEIAFLTKGLGVLGFTDPGPYTLPSLRHLKAGDTTDDWALTAANARALIRGKGDYVLEYVVDEHLRAFHTSTVGWGRTTRRALAEVNRYVMTRGKEGWDPRLTADPDPHHPKSGCGNGVAMKVAPFAVMNAVRQDDDSSLNASVIFNGRLTHPDPGAWTAAIAIALMISRSLTWPNDQKPLGGVPALPPLEDLIRHVEDAERLLEIHENPDRFSRRLQRLQDGNPRLLTAPRGHQKAKIKQVANVTGTGFHAFESCAFAIAVALRHPVDFRAAILEAINAGGDTDTNASMVGAIVGARVGLSGIPEGWRTYSQSFQEPLDLGQQLYGLQ